MSNAAKLLGWPQSVGTVAMGRLVVIVVVPCDCTQDVTVVDGVLFGQKHGLVYRGLAGAMSATR